MRWQVGTSLATYVGSTYNVGQVDDGPMVAPSAAKGSGARVITSDELALHNKEDDLWIAVAGKVYDLTK